MSELEDRSVAIRAAGENIDVAPLLELAQRAVVVLRRNTAGSKESLTVKVSATERGAVIRLRSTNPGKHKEILLAAVNGQLEIAKDQIKASIVRSVNQ